MASCPCVPHIYEYIGATRRFIHRQTQVQLPVSSRSKSSWSLRTFFGCRTFIILTCSYSSEFFVSFLLYSMHVLQLNHLKVSVSQGWIFNFSVISKVCDDLVIQPPVISQKSNFCYSLCPFSSVSRPDFHVLKLSCLYAIHILIFQ